MDDQVLNSKNFNDKLIIFSEEENKQKVIKILQNQFLGEKKPFTIELLKSLNYEQNQEQQFSIDQCLPSIWNLSNGKYSDIKFKKILKMVQQLNITVLFLQNNYNSAILKELNLCHHFIKLKILNLSNNNIWNLQDLNQLEIPQLESLFLDTNFIDTLRSLTHISMSKLKILSLQNNLLIDLEYYSELNLQQLNTLILKRNSKLCQLNGLYRSIYIPSNIFLNNIGIKFLKQTIEGAVEVGLLPKNVNFRY